jgi:hypothetical protein
MLRHRTEIPAVPRGAQSSAQGVALSLEVSEDRAELTLDDQEAFIRYGAFILVVALVTDFSNKAFSAGEAVRDVKR